MDVIIIPSSITIKISQRAFSRYVYIFLQLGSVLKMLWISSEQHSTSLLFSLTVKSRHLTQRNFLIFSFTLPPFKTLPSNPLRVPPGICISNHEIEKIEKICICSHSTSIRVFFEI